jgi:hypothetical protein
MHGTQLRPQLHNNVSTTSTWDRNVSIPVRFIDTLSSYVDGGNMKVGHTSYNSIWEKCAAHNGEGVWVDFNILLLDCWRGGETVNEILYAGAKRQSSYGQHCQHSESPPGSRANKTTYKVLSRDCRPGRHPLCDGEQVRKDYEWGRCMNTIPEPNGSSFLFTTDGHRWILMTADDCVS